MCCKPPLPGSVPVPELRNRNVMTPLLPRAAPAHLCHVVDLRLRKTFDDRSVAGIVEEDNLIG
jgi:hypothetical protein